MLQDHGGQSQIGYGLGRSDYQPGVYSQVGIRNYDGVVVRESPAPYLLRGVNCCVKLLYHAEGYVRFSFRDGSGVVWDTGEIPTYSPMRFDWLRFEVVPNSGYVEWRSGQGAMYLEGGISPSVGYVISGFVDNILFTTFFR